MTAARVPANSNIAGRAKPMSVAEALIAAAAVSIEVNDWIARQLLAGRKPSEILVVLADHQRVLH